MVSAVVWSQFNIKLSGMSSNSIKVLLSKRVELNLGVFVVAHLFTNNILIISDLAHDLGITNYPPLATNLIN